MYNVTIFFHIHYSYIFRFVEQFIDPIYSIIPQQTTNYKQIIFRKGNSQI
nr:MAG TPA: hypothetical protein [Caudoviricetes sp.]